MAIVLSCKNTVESSPYVNFFIVKLQSPPLPTPPAATGMGTVLGRPSRTLAEGDGLLACYCSACLVPMVLAGDGAPRASLVQGVLAVLRPSVWHS